MSLKKCPKCDQVVMPVFVKSPAEDKACEGLLKCPTDKCNRILGTVARVAPAEQKTRRVVAPLVISADRCVELLNDSKISDFIDGDAWLVKIKRIYEAPAGGIKALKEWQIKAMCTAFGPDCLCGAAPMKALPSKFDGSMWLCCRDRSCKLTASFA
jgi:hypothetical protein